MDSTRWELTAEIVGQALDLEADEREAFLAERTAADAFLRQQVESQLEQALGPEPRQRGELALEFLEAHRLLVGAVAALLLVLGCALAITTRRARRAEAHANQVLANQQGLGVALREAQATNAFLDQAWRAAAQRQGEITSLRATVDLAGELLDEAPDPAPLVEGRLRTLLGATLRGLGQAQPALDQLEQAVALRSGELGWTHRLTLATRYERIQALRDAGHLAQAAGLVEQLLEDWDAPHVLELAGLLAVDRNELELGRQLLERALAARLAEQPAGAPEGLALRKHLAQVATRRGELSLAASLLQEVLAVQVEALGPSHLDPLTTRSQLGALLWQQGHLAQAERLYREAYEGFDAQLPDGHPDRLRAGERLTALVAARGPADEVLRLGVPLFATADAALGHDHGITSDLRIVLASACVDLGRLEEAIGLARQIAESSERVHGNDALPTIRARRDLACFLLLLGEHAEAADRLRHALDSYARLLPADDPKTTDTACRLGQALLGLGRLEEAEALLARYAERQPDTTRGAFLKDRGACLRRLGRMTAAETVLLAAHELLARTRGPDDVITAATRKELALLYEQLGREDEATRWRAQAR